LEGRGFRTPTERVSEVTAVELLQRGARIIRNKLPEGQEERHVAAALLDAIGNSLTSLGDVSLPRTLVLEGLRIRNGLLPPSATESGESLYHLATLDHEARDLDAAERRYRDAIQIIGVS